MFKVSVRTFVITMLLLVFQGLVIAANSEQITVISPDYGDVLFCDHSYDIAWNSNGWLGKTTAELYRGDNYIMTISESNEGNNFIWKVPAEMTTGPDYRVKISSTVNYPNAGFSHYFRIAGDLRLNQNSHPEQSAGGRDWLIQTVDIGNVGYYSSIAVDSQNQPRISYYDNQNDDLKYAYRVDTTWYKETVDANGNAGVWTSIAVDDADHAHISYTNDGNRDLMYAYWNGSAWQIANVDYSGNRGEYTSIALDSTGSPLISYLFGGGGDLMYAFKAGTMWGTFCVDSDADCGRFTSLDLDNHDYPYISYHDYTWNRYWLKHAYWNGSSWSNEWVDTRYRAGHYSSVAITKNVYPPLKHISYQGISHCDHAFWNGSSWELATVDPNAGDLYINGSSVAVDTFGRPHIAYYRASSVSGGRLCYAFRRANLTWSIETVDSSADVGGHCSIAIDKNDYVHISYVDWSNGYLKYATRQMTAIEESGEQQPAKLSLNAIPNPSRGPGCTIEYIMDRPAHANLSVYNIAGQKIKNLVNNNEPAGKHQVFWDHADHGGNDISNGVYILILETSDRTLAKKILVMR